MSTPKFKVGDRVKFKDVEGRACVGLINSFYQYDCDNWRYALEGNGVLSWHESHLSLDVPETKEYATDLEAQLAAEIITLHYATTDRERSLSKVLAMQTKELTEAREQIERLRRIEKNQAIACEHLSNRLSEEIGGRARERIAKEASDKRLLHASELLICETQSFMKERQLKEAAQKELADVRQDLADLRTISRRLAL